jgi:hypothetical protein
MRKLKLLLVLCVVAMTASASKTVYLVPGPWNDANATERYALYMFDNDAGTNAWTSFTEGANGIWSAEFDDQYPNMIICRMDGASTENDWANKWTQTADLAAPFADGLTYTISGRDDNNNANNTYYISAYLYNPTTGLFLSRGAGYGTACWADNFGIPVIFIANDGGYRLQYIDQTDQYVSDAYWSWADGGTDRAQTYTVSAVEGGYKFINKAHGDANLTLYIAEGADDNRYTHQIASNGKYGDNCNENWDVWQLKSSTEREAIVAEKVATAEAAMATALGYTLASGQTLKALVEDVNTFAASNLTSSITNAALTGDYSTGWSYAKKNNGGNPTTNNSDGVEVYQGCGTFSQTVTGLANGLYKVTVQAYYRDGWNERCAELSNNGWRLSNAYLEANGNQTMIADWASDRANDGNPNGTSEGRALFNAGKYVNEVFAMVTDGTLAISIAQPGGATAGRWFFISNATLTYYSDTVSDEDAAAIIQQAETLEEKVMPNTAKEALTNAKTTFSGAKTIANYNALGQAIAEAQASVNAYQSANTYFEEVGAILENTNVYTTEAYNTYYATPKAAYEARTLTKEAANALVYKLNNGWQAQNTLDDILLSTWTQDGVQCKDFDKSLYINTWSIEGNTDGSDFFAPFFEYWVSSSNTLAANSFVSTITGLKANETYSFTIRARVQPTDGKTMIDNAITMKVGDSEAVCISSGTKFGTTNYYIGNFTAVGTTDANGNLVVTITIADASNVSWLSFYNCKYVEGEDLSAYIADYEFALNTAKANQSNTKYVNVTGQEKTNLDEAIDTYSTVDLTSKADLIAAKNALETASNTFVNAVASYDAFVAAKNATYNELPYASTAKYDALTTALSETAESAADADAKRLNILTAYRLYVESNARAEGVIGSEIITVPNGNMDVAYNSESHTFGAWQVFGQTNGTINWYNGESFTTGDDGDTYMYADIYKNDNNAGIQQTMNLSAGKYLLTVTARAGTAAGASFKLFANDVNVDIPRIGNTGGTFDRGWNDVSLEFTINTTTDVRIGVQSGNGKDLWWSASRFRLAKIADVIDENVDYTPVEATKSIVLNRTIKADTWNTIWLPFSMTEAELKATFGDDVEIAQFSETPNANVPGQSTINFNKSDKAISPNVPVLLKTSTAGTAYEIAGRTIVAGTPTTAGTNFDFVGTTAASTTVAEGDYFIGSNKLFTSTGSTTLKGTRAYLQGKSEGARIVNFSIDGNETTAIENLEQGTITTGKVYNLQGQEVKSAQKGIFIQNGKKVVIK